MLQRESRVQSGDMKVYEWGWKVNLKPVSGSTKPLTPVLQRAREGKLTSERMEGVVLGGGAFVKCVRQQESHSLYVLWMELGCRVQCVILNVVSFLSTQDSRKMVQK